MTNNIAYNSLKTLMTDLFGDILYWPVWWYSKGLARAGLFCLREIKDQEESLGLRIWVKNLFTPMYGQYDIEGRIISFFMRLVQIIFRSILLAAWAILMLLVFILWLLLPPFIIYQIAGYLR